MTASELRLLITLGIESVPDHWSSLKHIMPGLRNDYNFAARLEMTKQPAFTQLVIITPLISFKP